LRQKTEDQRLWVNAGAAGVSAALALGAGEIDEVDFGGAAEGQGEQVEVSEKDGEEHDEGGVRN